MLTTLWIALLPAAVFLEVLGLIAMRRYRLPPDKAPDFSSGLRPGRLSRELQTGAEGNT
jgi:hypothetical protein